MVYSDLWREEQLKNQVATDWFSKYDCTKIIGNIDFCVAKITEQSGGKQYLLFDENFKIQSLLWAESKRGKSFSIEESIVQLIITIGKAKTYEKYLPPVFLGAFDAQKIAFIPYMSVSHIFVQNDFNWKVAPSNHSSKEFKYVQSVVQKELSKEMRIFSFEEAATELKTFIQNNFNKLGRSGIERIPVTKNNFTTVYFKWLKTVKPTIKIDWEKAKKQGIIDADFYLADLLSKDNKSIKDSLFVLLNQNMYSMSRKEVDELGLKEVTQVFFNDNQRAHHAFWIHYTRPPRKEFWNYIVERRDLLVPPDVRERKGSFFTPAQWVELSQKYLADVLGENWQDEYYIWDCCAGTGNLLTGLTNKRNIWASTLDKADVDVMKDRIQNGANLFESHVFQMDFLNDRFEDKCPKKLLDIIQNPQKRKRLLIYINPPYAECGLPQEGSGKKNVQETNIHRIYKKELGQVGRDLYPQFMIRIFKELNGCHVGLFSKTKTIQSPGAKVFRRNCDVKIEKCFLSPAWTFDNVSGFFPIGFFVYDTLKKENYNDIIADVYDETATFLLKKSIFSYDNKKLINDWLKEIPESTGDILAKMNVKANDFGHQNRNYFCAEKGHLSPGDVHRNIGKNNLIKMLIYLAVRLSSEQTWFNDRDQFLYPNDHWKTDKNFQSDCLAYMLFHTQNYIIEGQGIKIPFTESEIGVKDEFESHFITDFIKENGIAFSNAALKVFDAGRELWKYYHSKPNTNINASFYDIRSYFQGVDEKGKMRKNSSDQYYTELISNLRQALKDLANEIKPKVYEYDFLCL